MSSGAIPWIPYSHKRLLSVTLCEETGWRMVEGGLCPVHGGDACLYVYSHPYWRTGWPGNVMLACDAGDTILVLGGGEVRNGDVYGLQSGERVQVLKVLGVGVEGVHVEVIRGYGRTVVQGIAKLDACWLLESGVGE